MSIIIDSGPLVAILDKRDQNHEFAIYNMKELAAPFYTCEAVISETFFLLQRAGVSQNAFVEILNAGKIQVQFSYSENAAAVHRIIEKYADLPASFADACLVEMHDTIRGARIFTVDDDFNIYRSPSGNPLSLVAPQ